MKTYKIGNLPFVFTSRKQLGEFTIFDNGDGVTFRIKTETLNKNTSIIDTDNVTDTVGFSDLINRIEVLNAKK